MSRGEPVVPGSPSSIHRNTAFISNTKHAFLLAPPPPPRFKRKAPVQPPSPPSRRTRSNTPVAFTGLQQSTRSPLSPRESFLNIIDTPSPDVKKSDSPVLFYNPTTPVTPRTSLTTPGSSSFYVSEGLHKSLGYSVTIEARYRSTSIQAPSSPVSPEPTTSPLLRRTKSRSKSVSVFPAVTAKIMGLGSLSNLNILSRSQHTSSKPPTSGPAKTPLMQRSNLLSRSTSRSDAAHPPSKSERRSSVPSVPKHHASHSQNCAETPKKEQKQRRYPLPLPYSAVVEMEQILGNSRSASGVHPFMAAPQNAAAHERGGTGAGPLPYIGADGRMWRDRDEELEYTALLAEEMRRRGSGDSVDEEVGRSRWKIFGGSKAGGAIRFAEQKLRTPSSANSSEYNDEPDYSPLSAHMSQAHSFAQYSFPTHTNVTPLPLPGSVRDFSIPAPSFPGMAPHPRQRRRPSPLPLSSASSFIPPPPVPQSHGQRSASAMALVPPVIHPMHAKDDFLASSFTPAPLPPSSRLDERRERAKVSRARPPTSTPRHPHPAASSSASLTSSSTSSKAKSTSNGFLSIFNMKAEAGKA